MSDRPEIDRPELRYLADCPDLIPTIAEWHTAQWGYLSRGSTYEQRVANLSKHLGRPGIPTTFVAFVGEQPAGCASLVAQDMRDARPDLSPWLASVYVQPAHRHRGLGAALVNRVAAEARTLDTPTLYLYTEDRDPFYARLGWQVVERRHYRGYWMTVMSLDLTATLPAA